MALYSKLYYRTVLYFSPSTMGFRPLCLFWKPAINILRINSLSPPKRTYSQYNIIRPRRQNVENIPAMQPLSKLFLDFMLSLSLSHIISQYSERKSRMSFSLSHKCRYAISSSLSVGVNCGKKFEIRGDLWRQKTRVHGLSCGIICVILRLAVLIQYRSVTDRQTDRHDDGIYRASIASRGKEIARVNLSKIKGL